MIRRLKFPYKKISFIGLILKMPRLKWKNIIFLMEKKKNRGRGAETFVNICGMKTSWIWQIIKYEIRKKESVNKETIGKEEGKGKARQ